MVQDAEANAEADKKKKDLAEARNGAEAMVHQTESQLEEFGDKVPAADKEAIEAALAELKEVKDGEDPEAIQQKTQALVQAAMKLGEAMYAAQQAEGAEGGETASDETSSDDDVVDAEFSEVDDENKKDG
jgi:molecular chaperone DnaK